MTANKRASLLQGIQTLRLIDQATETIKARISPIAADAKAQRSGSIPFEISEGLGGLSVEGSESIVNAVGYMARMVYSPASPKRATPHRLVCGLCRIEPCVEGSDAAASSSVMEVYNPKP